MEKPPTPATPEHMAACLKVAVDLDVHIRALQALATEVRLDGDRAELRIASASGSLILHAELRDGLWVYVRTEVSL